MRFKQFIIEQTQLNEARPGGDFTIKGLSDEEWVDWVEQNCGDYLPRAGEHPIYRGFSKLRAPIKLGVKDTNEFTRRSLEISNYFTLWMDNAVQWKNFPKRSKSFVGSSNFHLARAYGKTYQLFPANDAKIGICPQTDLWYSFDQFPYKSVGSFVYYLQIVIEKIFDKWAAKRAETDWIELRRLLIGISPNKFVEIVRDLKMGFNVKIPEQFTRYPTLIDYLENEITPEKHGFVYATPATYSVTRAENKEVWVQGKVAMLNVYSIFRSRDGSHLFPKTLELLSKHNIRKPY